MMKLPVGMANEPAKPHLQRLPLHHLTRIKYLTRRVPDPHGKLPANPVDLNVKALFRAEGVYVA